MQIRDSGQIQFPLGSRGLTKLKRTLVRKTLLKKKSFGVVSYKTVDGRKYFTGGPKLKKTQVYPLGYGQACQKLISQSTVDVDEEFEFDILEEEVSPYMKGAECWRDASLDDVWKVVFKNYNKVK